MSQQMRKGAWEELRKMMRSLERRRGISKMIGHEKLLNGIPTEDPSREFELRGWIKAEFGEEGIYGRILNEVLKDSLELQGYRSRPTVQSALTDATGRKIVLANVGEPHYDDYVGLGMIGRLDVRRVPIDRYSSPGGSAEVKGRLAEFMASVMGHNVSSEEVMFTEGGRFGMYSALLATSRGRSTAFFDPSWPAFEELAWEANARPYKFALTDPTWELKLPPVMGDIDGSIIVNSPGNPTGKVMSSEELRSIMDSMSNSACLIDDESYRDLTFAGKRVIYPGEMGFERFVCIYSFSKGFGLPGLRIGVAVGDKSLIKEMERIQQKLLTSPPAYDQAIAMGLIEHREILESHRKESQKKMELVYRAIRSNDRYEFSKPDGGLYFFIRDRAEVNPWVTLMKKGLATAPGISFGDYPNYFRFTFLLNRAELGSALAILNSS